MFEIFFKKKKKGNIIPLEVQLERLEQLGISLSSGATIEDLLNEMDREELESNPYLSLLIALGCEFETGENVWKHISNNIWYLDTECIEDNGDYVRIVERLITLSQRALKIENLSDAIDIEANEAIISFVLEGEHYSWPMEVNDDWLDINLLSKLNVFLNKLSSEKKFFVAVIDQTCLIGFLKESQVNELNKLIDIRFESI